MAEAGGRGVRDRPLPSKVSAEATPIEAAESASVKAAASSQPATAEAAGVDGRASTAEAGCGEQHRERRRGKIPHHCAPFFEIATKSTRTASFGGVNVNAVASVGSNFQSCRVAVYSG